MLHHDFEVRQVFYQQYRDFCCKRPNKYLNVWEGKLKESNFDVDIVYLKRVFGYSQMHKHCCLMSSFSSVFKYIWR
jgi:hypothetical protein